MGRIKLFFDFNMKEDVLLVKEAERLEYAGVALFKHQKNHNNSNNNKIYFQADFETIKKNSSIHIYRGVEILAKNPEDMKRKVQKARKEAEVLMVHGGDLKINRAACEDPRVDIISHPYHGRRDSGINHVFAKKAAENNVAVELNLKYLFKTRSHLRYKILTQFREILKLHRKFNFPLIITSNSKSIYDLHTPQDIIALTRCFGMKKEEAKSALSETPQNIIERSKIRSSVLIGGVKIVD